MSSPSASRLRRVPFVLLAVAGALMLALSLLPPAAQAHDTLIATDPEDGATLETSPEQITLTYSADILDVSPVVRISDEDGEMLAEITPRVEGPDAIAEIDEPLPAGTHTVQWRVVSSDGHPIEGTLTLTVEQDPAPEDQGAASEDGAAPEDGVDGDEQQTEAPAPISESPETPSDETEDSEPAAAATEEDSGSSALPLLLGVVGVAVVGVAIAAFFGLRRKDQGDGQDQAQDQDPGQGQN